MDDPKPQQVSLDTESELKARRDKLVSDTLDALVAEAYKAAIDRGEGITNPAKWTAWKRGVYIDTAKREGKGYLQKHHARLIGGSPVAATRFCAFCEAPIGVVWLELGEKMFCDMECAEGKTAVISYADWLVNVRARGGYVSPETGIFVPIENMVIFDPPSLQKKLPI